jgi:hypothetical protein
MSTHLTVPVPKQGPGAVYRYLSSNNKTDIARPTGGTGLGMVAKMCDSHVEWWCKHTLGCRANPIG